VRKRTEVRHCRQANTFGAGGFVSTDGREVIEVSQNAFASQPFHGTLAEPGGRDVADVDHVVTDALIRGQCRDGSEIKGAES
jgi:salicylate 5-hydroxylase large subunit